jgi:hypothetical protein
MKTEKEKMMAVELYFAADKDYNFCELKYQKQTWKRLWCLRNTRAVSMFGHVWLIRFRHF